MNTGEYIDSLLSLGKAIPAPERVRRWAPQMPDQDAYNAAAFADPGAFWMERAHRIVWETPPSQGLTGTFGEAQWFADGRLNATQTVLDRPCEHYPDDIAYHYLCETGSEREITYAQLRVEVARLANALRADGVRSGDRVCIYMPLTIEGIVAMLACARIGAIHSVIYAGLGATALRDRIEDAGANVVIAADVTYRRGKPVDLKSTVDDAIRGTNVRRVIVWRRETSGALAAHERDYAEYVSGQPETCAPEIVAATAPLFILYTSGSTGKPKGVVMTHGGYLVGTAAMLAETTGITRDDVYWCTSDIGWIVGHSLIVYGALANGYRCVIREGAPDFPQPTTTYELLARLRVTKLYTAPTLARMLMRLGTEARAAFDLSALEAVYCAGEPLNPEAWRFLFEEIGRGEVAVCNQWWQTETGAMMMGFLPTATVHPDRSGKAFGPIAFAVLDRDGNDVPAGSGGLLAIRQPWPHMFAGTWGDRARYLQYFEQIPGVYTAGDVATCDAQGYFTVLGRADDVLNVAGHRIATADVESALVSHPACGEAAAIGKPDAIKGEVIKAFVVLRAGHATSDDLAAEMIAHVRYALGPIATPAEIAFVPKLPKTRSGKIMRRLLKAQETGAEIGDVTTLED